MANGEISPENQRPEIPEDELLPAEIQEVFTGEFGAAHEQNLRFLRQSAKDLDSEVVGIRLQLESLLEDQAAHDDPVRARVIEELTDCLTAAEIEMVYRRRLRDNYPKA